MDVSRQQVRGARQKPCHFSRQYLSLSLLSLPQVKNKDQFQMIRKYVTFRLQKCLMDSASAPICVKSNAYSPYVSPSSASVRLRVMSRSIRVTAQRSALNKHIDTSLLSSFIWIPRSVTINYRIPKKYFMLVNLVSINCISNCFETSHWVL